MELSEKLLKEQEQIEQEIKLFMGEHEAAENASYRVSWSNVDTVRIDSKRLKSEQPEIYQKFSKQSQSRRFSVRAA